MPFSMRAVAAAFLAGAILPWAAGGSAPATAACMDASAPALTEGVAEGLTDGFTESLTEPVARPEHGGDFAAPLAEPLAEPLAGPLAGPSASASRRSRPAAERGSAFVDGAPGEPNPVRRLDTARPRIAFIALDDTRFGTGDGRIDPGETLEMALAVENDGLVDLTDATLVVRGAGRPSVSVRGGRHPLPIVSFGQVFELETPTRVTLPLDAPCGTEVAIEIVVGSKSLDRPYRTCVRVVVGSTIASVPRFPLAAEGTTREEGVTDASSDPGCRAAHTPIAVTVVAEPAEDGSIDVLALVENRTATRLEGRLTLVGTLASGRERGRPGGAFALGAGEMTIERFRLARGLLASHRFALATRHAGSTPLSLAVVASSRLFGEELGIAFDRVRVDRRDVPRRQPGVGR